MLRRRWVRVRVRVRVRVLVRVRVRVREVRSQCRSLRRRWVRMRVRVREVRKSPLSVRVYGHRPRGQNLGSDVCRSSWISMCSTDGTATWPGCRIAMVVVTNS